MSESGKTVQLSYYSPCNEEAYALELKDAADLTQISDRMLAYYHGYFTHELLFRTKALKRLGSWLKSHEIEILDALRADLGIKTRDAYLSELMPVTKGLRLTLANLKTWSKPNSTTKLALPFTTKVKTHQSPLGLVTIAASHTHPLQDCLGSLIQAISAGNCVLLCPHEAAPNTAQVLRRLCQECFDSRFIFCLPSTKTAKSLALKCKVAKIFFYGSAKEGISTLLAAANSLSPVSLKLDAACPCIIDADADLRRLLHTFTRSTSYDHKGTHGAPSHLFIHESRQNELIDRLDAKLAKASISSWQEEDRYRLAKKIEELGRIDVCYLFSNDERLQKNLAQRLSCEVLLINDYPGLIADNRSIIPGRRKRNASYLQAKLSFESYSQSKISLKKPNLLELPLRIAKNANEHALRTLASHKAETEQK